jgi:uncharacterized surface protein with fasciclin (FAS1) repeats
MPATPMAHARCTLVQACLTIPRPWRNAHAVTLGNAQSVCAHSHRRRSMSFRQPFLALNLAFASVFAAPVFADHHESTDASAKSTQNIVAIASSNPQFSTLVAALKAADLVGTLEGAGPFTVFAPTDAAFAKLPAGTLDSLLKPENKAKLAAILTYHVVAGNVLAADVVKLNTAKTVNGQSVAIAVNGGKVSIDGANVSTTDIKASNGVIHVIDSVILPKG